ARPGRHGGSLLSGPPTRGAGSFSWVLNPRGPPLALSGEFSEPGLTGPSRVASRRGDVANSVVDPDRAKNSVSDPHSEPRFAKSRLAGAAIRVTLTGIGTSNSRCPERQ